MPEARGGDHLVGGRCSESPRISLEQRIDLLKIRVVRCGARLCDGLPSLLDPRAPVLVGPQQGDLETHGARAQVDNLGEALTPSMRSASAAESRYT